jgi:hypothetical protein
MHFSFSTFDRGQEKFGGRGEVIMRSFAISACLFIAFGMGSLRAEIYRVFPRSIDPVPTGASFGPYVSARNYPNPDNPFVPFVTNPISVTSGPILYDANINGSGNGTIIIPSIFMSLPNRFSQYITFASDYPNTVETLNGLRFRINAAGPLSVVNGQIQGLTATFYAGTYAQTTFFSRTASGGESYVFDFNANPYTFGVTAQLYNGPWPLVVDTNPSLFFDTDPFDNPPGLTGLNPSDSESAGIFFQGLSGTPIGTYSYDYQGTTFGNTGPQANPFALSFAATVPEAGTTTLLAIAGGLGLAGWGARWVRSRR